MNDQREHWGVEATRNLAGKVVREVRYLTDVEMEDLDWNKSCAVVIFTDNTCLFPSQDDEGNNAGALFTNIEGFDTIPVCR